MMRRPRYPFTVERRAIPPREKRQAPPPQRPEPQDRLKPLARQVHLALRFHPIRFPKDWT